MNGESVSSSLASRVELWLNSFYAWLDRPLLGHGLGAFEQAYAPHRSDHLWLIDSTILALPWNAAGQAHNVILQSLIEIGLVGTILAGVFLWTVLRMGISSALVATGVLCMIGFPEQNPASAIMIACALACASRVDSSSP